MSLSSDLIAPNLLRRRRERRRRTRGHAALVRALRHVTAREVGARCRVSPMTVSHWAAATRLPSEAARVQLEKVYGVAAASRDEISCNCLQTDDRKEG
jgi:transcriptional regulator with XRE-family HTH domain